MGSRVKLPTEIILFKYEWGFLSSFHPAVVYLWVNAMGEVFAHEVPDCTIETYASVEPAYQAFKTLNAEARKVFTLTSNPNLKPGQAKRMGAVLKDRGLERPDWKQINVGVMRELLIQKFTPSILQRKLLSTFNAKLVEGNYWHDIFWGVCMGEIDGHTCRRAPHEPVGENILGQLLMEVRTFFAQPQPLRQPMSLPLQPQPPE